MSESVSEVSVVSDPDWEPNWNDPPEWVIGLGQAIADVMNEVEVGGDGSESESDILTPPPPPRPKKRRRLKKSTGYGPDSKPKVNFSKFKIGTIETLSDLIDLAARWKKFKKNHSKPNDDEKETFIERECNKVESMVPELKQLNNMIGLQDFKKSIVNQILYSIQGLHGTDLMNIVITGPPGCGKSTLGEIIGKLYKKMGLLSKGTFNIIRRTDLIGEYIGHTAQMTKRTLDRCLGGVIFIDEAYSIGAEKTDTKDFSHECINILNQYLSEHTDILCILAGYKDSIQNKLFALNPGLDRRFPWKYDIKRYTSNELLDIFKYTIKNEDGWKLKFRKLDPLQTLFNEYYSQFKNQGGDCKNILNRCKIVHAQRIFGLSNKQKEKERFRLTVNDIKQGFKDYFKEEKQKPFNGMYI